MASTKEIKNRMKSVSDTRKITGAMHLISATKLQKAKAELDRTRPYFEAVKREVKRVFRTVDARDSRYFFPEEAELDFEGTYAYLVITADKGLAGAYNHNVLREAQRMLAQHDDNQLFVVGEFGRQYFASHHIPIEQSFLYTAQSPTLRRAREICSILLNGYNTGRLRKIFVIYTDIRTGLENEVVTTRLLPFHHGSFASGKEEEAVDTPFEFEPSPEEVLENVVHSYVTGFIYSAMVSSFCCEETARMTAMDSANTNAENLMEELNQQYHHIRQSDITREITEIASGSRSLKKKAGGLRKELSTNDR